VANNFPSRARAAIRTEYGGIDRSAACMHAAVDTETIVHTPRACVRAIDTLCSTMKKKRASDDQLPVRCRALPSVSSRLVASHACNGGVVEISVEMHADQWYMCELKEVAGGSTGRR
jgi:hypothetical protein